MFRIVRVSTSTAQEQKSDDTLISLEVGATDPSTTAPLPASKIEDDAETSSEVKPASKRVERSAPAKPAADADRGHFRVSAHTIDMESILGELESPPAIAHASTDSVEVDLSIVLNDIEKPEQGVEEAPANGGPDLEGIFARLRGDVARRSAMDDAEQQYTRALTLREAGDIDGCIAALEAASHAPKLRFVTASLLGGYAATAGGSSGHRVVRESGTGAGSDGRRRIRSAV